MRTDAQSPTLLRYMLPWGGSHWEWEDHLLHPLHRASLRWLITVASHLLVALLLVLQADTVDAASNISFPAPAGTRWQIASGYNTATHSEADKNDPYAIDVVRSDAETAGTPVLAPMDGRIGYASGDCISITDAQQTSALICHILFSSGLRGKNVVRGEALGTVAPAGQAGNGGTPHIHLALARNRLPVPFTGDYNLEGIELPATTTPNGYSGTAFSSSNLPRLGVNAGADQQVRPGATVTMTATAVGTTGAVMYQWTQTSGPSVALTANGATATFVAPATSGATLQFQAVAYSQSLQPSMDSVTVNVSRNASTSTPTPISAPRPIQITTGVFLGPPMFSSGGIALAVFSGGTVVQLESATTGAQGKGVWVQDPTGAFRLLVSGGPAFVNDGFRAAFPVGFTNTTAVTVVR